MFSGIISEMGVVSSVTTRGDGAIVEVRAHDILEGLPPGGSLAVDGVCLTALPDEAGRGVFTADLMGETLARTTLGSRGVGSRVNLERCVTPTTHLDGHVVQGHVDTVGTVTERTDHGAWTTLRCTFDPVFAPLVAEKGSIALNGVSLTITGVSEPHETSAWCEVGLIPTTMAHTNLGDVHIGDHLNLEFDVLAKYTQRMLAFSAATGVDQ